MKKELVNCISQNLYLNRFSLISFVEKDTQIIEGVIWDSHQCWYPIIKGVPCFLSGLLKPDFTWFQKKYNLPSINGHFIQNHQEDQLRTNETFSDKWNRFKNYGLESNHQEFLYGWYCKKLGLSTLEELKSFYQQFSGILEVGPGSGFNTKFMAENTQGEVFSVDVSDAAYTTFENTKHLANCHVVQADLMSMPFADCSFDFIIADGVLHHTPDTKKALFAVYKKLKPNGQMFFYVYKQMGAARQFCDRYIREHFTHLEPDECYKACEGLTELGRELSHLNAKITLEKDIPVLGIPAGTHDVQRLFYYNFVKCFWNDAFDFETNNMVNFDWYHPHNAWQHTETEVAGWLQELGVSDYKFNDANPNGISVLLTKPSL
ncbi:class I SAM-dependent methyltransferase [Pseudanabaena sp. ABRG5-3]|uniref:class I SAM-dependent methyltransferase n=1 Tax=Pseudanabaena sp. ABRG5-3 TaxID=685565 RepID=UPI000DC715E7|nr:class I SAM-dependent methyltransferase [Pseudanabaena sp. ABRG5-3]BBC22724.1 SAM dependent methyltransferase [Pseudanabaena sp. ABRG5-3]